MASADAFAALGGGMLMRLVPCLGAGTISIFRARRTRRCRRQQCSGQDADEGSVSGHRSEPCG
ncbi:hypothetical protein [Burkholderia glumae]|uniref:hypothetical protein n=1 Tax=Burkholderia glumae TaxID=337 RepID=UPI00157B6953|nr:hypothetical protein [Burkholderia glumae]